MISMLIGHYIRGTAPRQGKNGLPCYNEMNYDF